MRLHNAISVLLLAMSVSLCAVSCGRSGYVSITGYAQGGTYLVKLNTDGSTKAPETIKHEIDSILNVIDFSVSGYNKSSILSKFNAGETVTPDEVFIDIYGRSRALWKETEGVVDVAAAPLFDIWGFGFTTDSLPSEDVVARVLETCGMDRLAGDMSAVIAPDGTLDPRDMLACDDRSVLPRLNYNAIAQGYTVDLLGAYLHSIGVHDMLINVGGEIYSDGVNPSGKAWTLGIDRPEDDNDTPGAEVEVVFCSDGGPCGIVTSGNYRKFYMKDGRKYAHTVDPRTGWPVSHSLLSATIIAPDATEADALATCCMVLGLEDASALILSRDDLEGCLIYDEDGTMKSWTSPGFILGSTSR